MHLFILGIIGSLLLPKAHTLECYICFPGATGECTDRTQCPEGFQCAATTARTNTGGYISSDIVKSCAKADDCVDGSANFGVFAMTFTTRCCSTDLCNSQPAPVPAKIYPNGKKCFSCVLNKCTTTQHCEGDEDHCISSTATAPSGKYFLKGCATKSVCEGLMGVKQNKNFGTHMSCCQGDFCNSASSITVNLLLLLLPLLSSALF
ncbi:phospholipase A2 inhibitor and Ly6/PLAUR domain-containing protein-like [Genypterus blacodes]|uniref:phospholipase A2 inhibitor and Ly6/PLAUR domain-containing protein-like n=1 Tax=Genypterus blacodes TaxID=154954 RepID=UPI003F774DCA